MKKFETKAIHVGQEPEKLYGSVSLPIYQTSTFKQKDFGEYLYDYSRAGNPTRTNLEDTISALEEGVGAAMFSSGMAAISSVLSLLAKDDHVIFTKNVYGGTYRLVSKILVDFGLDASWVDTTDLDAISSNIKGSTKIIFIESPTNPMMELSDISAIGKLAHSHGLLLVVDNTFMSPYFQRPLKLGADVVLHSTTKYINGHSDVIGGVVVSNDEEIIERLHFIQMSIGAVPGPMDCWLTQRSLKTLAVRMQAHNLNAMKIAEVLNGDDRIKRTIYPGLTNHSQHALASYQQLDPSGNPGYGGMLSIVLENIDKARAFTKELNIFTLAESLGGVESLICHPASMTHASIPSDIRDQLGISDGLLRLSVGIEHIDDLLEDILSAIKSL